VLFDLDGTLLQTDRTSVPAVEDTCREFGVPSPPREATMAFPGQPAAAWYEWLRSLVAMNAEEAFVAAVDRRELARVAGPEAPYEGALAVVQRLHAAGFRLEVCTNATQDYATAFLQGQAVEPWFAACRCLGHGYTSKPAMVANALRETGMPPEQTVVVGDRAGDLEAARENGTRAIAAMYGFALAGELDGADAAIDAIDDLPPLLEAWWP
jgi:phosphoglycolate phosphatase